MIKSDPTQPGPSFELLVEEAVVFVADGAFGDCTAGCELTILELAGAGALACETILPVCWRVAVDKAGMLAGCDVVVTLDWVTA